MHYYQFHIGDYRKDTAHLTPIEHYIYRSLIDWYYLDEKPIPNETQMVIRRLSLDFSYEKNLQNVLVDFFVSSDKGWVHRRIEVDIKDYAEKVGTNRINGRLGGRPKKTQSVSVGLPDESEQNPTVTLTKNQEPITINHKPKKTDSTYSDEFLTFWDFYPKKTGKGDAWTLWRKLSPDLNSVLSALSWQIKSKQWKSGYIPNPKTYLNGRRWEDSPVNIPEQSQKPQNVQESRLDTANQIWGRNGTDSKIIDINPRSTIEGHGTSVPEIALGFRESDVS